MTFRDRSLGALGTCLLLLVFLSCAPLRGATMAGTERTTAALDAFFQGAVPGALDAQKVPGAAWVYMRGPQVLCMGATGFADQEAGRPMDAKRSVFRMGSISKLFTAIAIMQFVEKGQLALDDEIRRRLPDLRLGELPGSEPIRVSHLLTHGGGFDAGYEAVVGRRAEDMLDLKRYLDESLPPRVRPPGQVVQYCNHGAAILGLLVERLGGEGYGKHMERRLFEPLGMASSTFGPLSVAPKRRVAGYDLVMGSARRCTTPFFPSPPVGGLSSTVEDMSHLMAALLDPATAGKGFLQTETLQLMMSRQFTNYPGFPGLGYGFFEYDRGALRIVGHGGGVLGFACNLYLFPAYGEAFFMASNSNRGFHAIVDVKERLLKTFFPEGAEAGPFDERTVAELPEAVLDGYVGCYRGNRSPRTSWNAMLAQLVPVLPVLRIRRAGKGRLAMETVKWYVAVRERVELEAVGRDLFRRLDGKAMVAFRRDGAGRVSHMFFSSSPVKTFDRLQLWDEQLVHVFLLLTFGLLFGWALGKCVMSLVWKRFSPPVGLGMASRLLVAILAAVNLFIPVIPLIAALPIRDGVPRTLFGVDPIVGHLLALPFLSALLTAPLVALAGRLCRKKELPGATRIFLALFTLGCLAYLPFLVYWNFLPHP